MGLCRKSYCEDDGYERNGVCNPYFRLQGVFLCGLYRESQMVPRLREDDNERRVYFSEEMVTKRKYYSTWKIQKGLDRTKGLSFSFLG